MHSPHKHTDAHLSPEKRTSIHPTIYIEPFMNHIKPLRSTQIHVFLFTSKHTPVQGSREKWTLGKNWSVAPTSNPQVGPNLFFDGKSPKSQGQLVKNCSSVLIKNVENSQTVAHCSIFEKEIPQAWTNVPSNFLKSVCAQNFQCATFYQYRYSSTFRTTCKICANPFFYRKIYVHSKFTCVRSSHAHTHSLEGTLVWTQSAPKPQEAKSIRRKWTSKSWSTNP